MVSMRLPAPAFNSAIKARGLDLATLSHRSGVPRSLIEGAIEGESDLDEKQIERLADELAVPIPALFARAALPLFPAVDFRTAAPRIGEFAKGTLHAIGFVERLSGTLSALDLNLKLNPSVKEFKTDTYSKEEAIQLAAEWRKNWGITDEQQLEWHDANKLYVNLRSYIESLGILVLHRSFKTDEAAGLYVHLKGGPHTVVINTTGSSKARKVFTLAHEFCHVLLRAEGASNPSVLKNKIEKFCNRFAACLLAPRRLIKKALERFTSPPRADDEFIRIFARRLGISQEATFLRLVETDYLSRDAYTSWKAKFHNTNHIPSGDTSDGGGGGTADPIRDKQTQFGSALLALLAAARRTGQLDEIDIFRLSGLKPRFQTELFGLA